MSHKSREGERREEGEWIFYLLTRKTVGSIWGSSESVQLMERTTERKSQTECWKARGRAGGDPAICARVWGWFLREGYDESFCEINEERGQIEVRESHSSCYRAGDLWLREEGLASWLSWGFLPQLMAFPITTVGKKLILLLFWVSWLYWVAHEFGLDSGPEMLLNGRARTHLLFLVLFWGRSYLIFYTNDRVTCE
jgi:hypothetical protein